MRNSVGEYLATLLPNWYARGGAAIGLLTNVLLVAWRETLVPVWVWLAVWGGALIVAQFFAFHKVREERESLREHAQSNILRLNDFLRTGNNLRNGIIHDPNLQNRPIEGWDREYETWAREVYQFLRANFPGLVGIFTNDAGFPPPLDWLGGNRRSGVINAMDRRLQRLQEIIMQLTRRP